MSKRELIEFIEELPDDLIYFTTEANEHDAIDIKVFTKPKSEDFLSWYFGP